MAQSIRVVGDAAHVPAEGGAASDARVATGAFAAWTDASPAAAALAAKRALDVTLALLLAILLAPVLLVAAAVVRLTSEGPVLYRQRRVGRARVPFTIYKLRTMCVDAEHHEARHVQRTRPSTAPAPALFHKPRCRHAVTPVGRLLRKYSIDEIPQLWNVLRGDMSLVGPRPLCDRELERWPAHAMRRFDARPGLTGSWQVSGRNLLHDEERLLLDLDYVDNWNLMHDLRILARTPGAVLSARGAW